MSKSTILALMFLPSAALASDPLKGLSFQHSPFEVCQDVTMISSSDFKKNEAFWKQAIGECGVEVQVLPDTGFFNTMIGRLGESEDAARSVDFLKKVGDRTAKYVDLNNRLTENLQRCALKDQAWFEQKRAAATAKEDKDFYDYSKCPSVMARMRKAMDELGPQARIKRAVIRETGSPWEWAKNALRAKIDIDRVPVTPEEAAKAKEQIAKDEAEIQKDFDAKIKKNMEKLAELEERRQRAFESLRTSPPERPAGQEFVDSMMKPLDSRELDNWFKGWYIETDRGAKPNIRSAYSYRDRATIEKRQEIFTKHSDDFSKLLGQLPMLAYLAKSNPSDKEIADAAAKVLKNGVEERQKILQALAEADKEVVTAGGRSGNVRRRAKTDQEKAKALYELMKYGPVVREILAEDPRHCQTATGVANHIMNTELRNMGGLVVGMIGAIGGAAVLGPAALAGTAVGGTFFGSSVFLASAVGAGFGGGLTWHDYHEYVDAKRRTFSVMETVNDGKAIAGVEEFDEARAMLAFASALSPVDLIGLGIYAKSGAVIGALTGKALERAGARNALASSMRSKGASNTEIEKFLADLQHSDPAVAQAAARRIVKYVGIEGQEDFLRMAASKGLLKGHSVDSLLAITKEIKDAQVYTRAVRILEDVNSAKINAGNRDQVLKAAIAGAEFGITDPKRLAAVINDWDQGLDGLAHAYRVAKTKLDAPDVRGLASLQARQEAAFSRALDELMEANPDFRALSPAERQATKTQMMRCGGKGRLMPAASPA
jgi:hypothetical protein